MPRRTFASQKELQDYAGQTGKVCRLEGVAKRQRLVEARLRQLVVSSDGVKVTYVAKRGAEPRLGAARREDCRHAMKALGHT